MRQHRCPKRFRSGAAAVEFAFCAPLLLLLLAGLWETGRIVEVEQVMYNACREGARSSSLASEYLDTGVGGINTTSTTPNVAAEILNYLQTAEPVAFGQGHSCTWSVASGLPANTTGYKCTDTTASPSRELFTITYLNLTKTSCTDPYNASKGDTFQICIQVPYSTVTMSPLAQITPDTRLYATVTWMCLRDTPFSVPTTLPAQ